MLQPNNQTTTLTCDFYRINAPEGVEFAGLLQGIASKEPADRNQDVSGGLLRLESWQTDDQVSHGMIVKLRTAEAGYMAMIAEEGLQDLALGEGAALAEYFGFRYNAANRVLLVQRKRQVGGILVLLSYVGQQSEVGGLRHEHVLVPATAAQVGRLRVAKEFEFSVAVPTQRTLFQGTNRSVGDVLGLTHHVGAGHIKVVLTIGRKRRGTGLVMQGIQELWADLEEAHLEPKVGKVTGLTEDDEMLPVNLLEGKMEQQVELRYTGPNPRVANVYDALDRAYRSRQQDLAQMF